MSCRGLLSHNHISMKYSKGSNNSAAATMKNLLLMAFAILTIGCGEQNPDGDKSTHVNQMRFVKGTFYLKNSDNPYTGKIIDSFKNGGKKIEFNIKNGKPHGLSTQWYENGKMQAKVNNRDGKHDGLTERWYENGQKAEEATYKEGKGNGLVLHWFENGQKAEESTYKAGELDGPGVSWHENGQKEMEGKWKNGQQEGLLTAWHENGLKQMEAMFKEGELISEKYWNSKGEEVDSLEEAEQ